MAKKFDWERVEGEKLISQKGKACVNIDKHVEMPPSLDELSFDPVPKKLKGCLVKFLIEVTEADIDHVSPPSVPDSLKPHITKYIVKKGGAIEFARWFPDSEIRRRNILKKRENAVKAALEDQRIQKKTAGQQKKHLEVKKPGRLKKNRPQRKHRRRTYVLEIKKRRISLL